MFNIHKITILLFIAISLIVLQSCYTVENIYRTEKAGVLQSDTAIIPKFQFRRDIRTGNFMIKNPNNPPYEKLDAGYNSISKVKDNFNYIRYPFVLSVSPDNPGEFVVNSCDSCLQVEFVATKYVVRQVKTDLTYREFDYWKTLLLNAGVGVVAGGLIYWGTKKKADDNSEDLGGQYGY